MNGALAFRICALFADVSPIPVKAALAELGLIRNELRLPLTPLNQAATEAVRSQNARGGAR